MKDFERKWLTRWMRIQGSGVRKGKGEIWGDKGKGKVRSLGPFLWNGSGKGWNMLWRKRKGFCSFIWMGSIG